MDENKIFEKSMMIILVTLFIGGAMLLWIENVQSNYCGDPPCWPEIKGEMGDNNWYISDVLVTFNGSFNNIYYRVDKNDWINYTAPFMVEGDGIFLLEWTCDCNRSEIYSDEIKIDQTTPMFGQYEAKWIGLFKWQLSVNATDDTSGVNRVLFYLPNSFDTEPPYQVIWNGCYWLNWLLSFHYIYYSVNVWDNAGNYLSSPSSN